MKHQNQETSRMAYLKLALAELHSAKMARKRDDRQMMRAHALTFRAYASAVNQFWFYA